MTDLDQLTDSGHNSLQSSNSEESQPEMDPFMGKVGAYGDIPSGRKEVTIKNPLVNNSIIEVRYRGEILEIVQYLQSPHLPILQRAALW